MSTFPANGDLPQSGSAVSRWLMDEASGNRADNIASNTLVDNNTVGAGTGLSTVTSSFDNSADFELGNSEYLSKSHTTALNGASGLTFAVWNNPESLATRMTIGGKWNDLSTIRRPWLFEVLSSSGDLTFIVSDSSSNRFAATTGTGVISTGTWAHLTVVYEASTRLTIYVDGAQESELTASIPSSLGDNTSSPFELGAHLNDSTQQRFFDGLQQDGIFWDTPLTDAEVTTLYELYTVSSVTGLPTSRAKIGVGK